MNTPSPEAKKILKEWCKLQEQKYGPDWKNKLAKYMADRTVPFMQALLKVNRK